MKKYVALSVLAVTTLGVVASHLDIERHDDSYFLRVDGSAMDVRGQVSAALNHARRNCDAIVQRLPSDLSDDPSTIAVIKAISEYSPPDSRHLKLRQLLFSDPWLLAEVEFPELEPAVILLEKNANGLAIHNDSIWSGSTQPWVAGPWIRRYLRQRTPQVPSALWDCFDPTSALFDPH
jgi:hypothetical protein